MIEIYYGRIINVFYFVTNAPYLLPKLYDVNLNSRDYVSSLLLTLFNDFIPANSKIYQILFTEFNEKLRGEKNMLNLYEIR